MLLKFYILSTMRNMKKIKLILSKIIILLHQILITRNYFEIFLMFPFFSTGFNVIEIYDFFNLTFPILLNF